MCRLRHLAEILTHQQLPARNVNPSTHPSLYMPTSLPIVHHAGQYWNTGATQWSAPQPVAVVPPSSGSESLPEPQLESRTGQQGSGVEDAAVAAGRDEDAEEELREELEEALCLEDDLELEAPGEGQSMAGAQSEVDWWLATPTARCTCCVAWPQLRLCSRTCIQGCLSMLWVVLRLLLTIPSRRGHGGVRGIGSHAEG